MEHPNFPFKNLEKVFESQGIRENGVKRIVKIPSALIIKTLGCPILPDSWSTLEQILGQVKHLIFGAREASQNIHEIEVKTGIH